MKHQSQPKKRINHLEYGQLVRWEMFEQFKRGKRFKTLDQAVRSAVQAISQTYQMA